MECNVNSRHSGILQQVVDYSEFNDEEMEAYSRFDQNQSDEDRHRIREQLTQLIEGTKGALEGTEIKSVGEIEETIKNANAVYKSVQFSREGVRDSELINICSSISRKKALELQTDHRRFDPVEFATKLRAFYCGEECNLEVVESEGEETDRSRQSTPTPTGTKVVKAKGPPITLNHWAKVGRYAYSLLRECPGLLYLNGAFDAGEVECKVAQRREGTKRTKIAQEKRLEEASDKDEEKNLEKTTRTVDSIARRLRKYCRKHGSINYFKVVLDPTDFGRTIENMFHVSFLIKDRLLKLEMNAEGLPILLALDGNEETSQTDDMKQCIMSITMDEWEELNRLFNIQEPFIPAGSI